MAKVASGGAKRPVKSVVHPARPKPSISKTKAVSRIGQKPLPSTANQRAVAATGKQQTMAGKIAGGINATKDRNKALGLTYTDKKNLGKKKK